MYAYIILIHTVYHIYYVYYCNTIYLIICTICYTTYYHIIYTAPDDAPFISGLGRKKTAGSKEQELGQLLDTKKWKKKVYML